jgi:hypothetical protein
MDLLPGQNGSSNVPLPPRWVARVSGLPPIGAEVARFSLEVAGSRALVLGQSHLLRPLDALNGGAIATEYWPKCADPALRLRQFARAGAEQVVGRGPKGLVHVGKDGYRSLPTWGVPPMCGSQHTPKLSLVDEQSPSNPKEETVMTKSGEAQGPGGRRVVVP